jgi:hypothetical protein
MKKTVVMLYLCIFPFAVIYPQSGVFTCTSNMENIFGVHKLKIRYEIVQYIY